MIRGDVAGQVGKLREETEGDVLVAGSALLVRSLADHDLVDEYSLITFPIILGRGKRLFGDGYEKTKLRLTDSRRLGPDGISLETYEPVREA